MLDFYYNVTNLLTLNFIVVPGNVVGGITVALVSIIPSLNVGS